MRTVLREYTVTRTVAVTQIHPDPFMTFGEFRAAREGRGISMKVWRACVGCNHKFTDAEDVYFCVVEGEGNRFLCLDCKTKHQD